MTTKLSVIQRRNRRWFLGFIVVQLCILFLAIIINPYRVLPFSITIPWVNDIKPRLYDNQRYTKIFDISRIKPKTVLLGSSRIFWGHDPNNPLLQQKGYQPVYNAGVIGPPMYEIKRYFDHALAVQPELKRVILGLDFYAFNAEFDGRHFDTDRYFGKNSWRILLANQKLIFDLKAILETFKYSALHQQVKMINDAGRLTPAPFEEMEVFKEFFLLHQDKFKTILQQEKLTPIAAPKTDVAVKPPQPQGRNVLYGNFKISQESLAALEHIIETCKRRHIELFIFFTPNYSERGGGEFSIFRQLGIWHDYENLLKRLASMHPFWTFAGVNEVNLNKDNYIDSSHYSFAIGDRIFETMLSKKMDGDFGYYINEKNVDRYVKFLNSEYKLVVASLNSGTKLHAVKFQSS